MKEFSVDILGYWGGFPVDGGATSSYLMTTDKGRVLIDCGSGSLSKLSEMQPVEDLDGLILSHLHNDHIADIKTVEHSLIVAKRRGLREKALPLYCPREPVQIFDWLQSDYFSHVDISNPTKYQIIGADVSFIPVRHTVPCFGIKIEYGRKSLFYTGDTEYFPSLANEIEGVDLLICEATIATASRHTSGKGHMDGYQAGRLAQLAGVKQLILTHLPSDGFHQTIKEEAQKEFEGPVFLASEKSHWQV